MQAPIYYFTVEGISSSVFESQVYAYVSRLRFEKIPTNLIIGQRYKARVSFKKLFRLSREKNTKFLLLPLELNYNKTANKLLRTIPENKKTILHCRNIEAAYIGLLAQKKNKNIQLIYDVRGYVEEEASYFNDLKKADIYKRLHQELFEAPIYFNFVSEKLKQAYEDKYRIDFKNYTICVSAYNDQIFNFSCNENIHSIPKVVFVGGNQSYQKIDSMVELIQKHGKIHFTIITNKKLLQIKSRKNLKLLYGLTQQEVAKELESMDYGILYRSKEAFNEVATPTKIAEYWGKGLKVIAINSAGAYTSIIQQNSILGDVIENEEAFLRTEFKIQKKASKEKIAKIAKENYSLTSNMKKYKELYKVINEEL